MRILIYLIIGLGMTGCFGVRSQVTHQYQLVEFSKEPKVHPSRATILVNEPAAVAAYQTEAMLYRLTPFELVPFLHNTWLDSPSRMLTPLMIQSLDASSYFKAIITNNNTDQADYRLDSQVMKFEQNFLHKPSTFILVVKVVLTKLATNTVLASRLITVELPCPSDSPWGGVVAANQATRIFTNKLIAFITRTLKAR